MSTIKLKRSAVPGKVPATSALELGEIAINTYDGNIYIKKNDGTESIVVFTTNAPSEILEKLLTVDGAGSGLDADFLDGESGAYYLDWTNVTNKPDPNLTVSLTGDVSGTANATFTDLANASITITATIADNSHNHVANNITDFTDAVTNIVTKSFVDGLNVDADTLDGQDSTYYLDWTNTTNKPDPNIQVTLSGDVSGTANTTLTDLANGVISVVTTVADNSHNHVANNITDFTDAVTDIVTKTFVDGLNVDADTLDGQDSTYYLDWTNTTNKPDPNIVVSLSGDVSGTANTTLTDLANGTISITTTVADNSHNHVSANITDFTSTVTGIVTKTYVDGLNVDADTLDGQDSTYYLDWTNVTNKPDPNIQVTLSGDVSGTANTTLTDLSSGTISITTTVADDSHNHIIANVDGLQDALDSKLPIGAKAVDSELLDGLDSTQFLRSDAVDVAKTIQFDGGVLYTPPAGAGTDNSSNVAIALLSGTRIVGVTNGYIHTLMTWADSSDIQIGQGSTALISGIDLLPGSSGQAKVNGNRILTVADEGAGNGLDSDTLDGQQGSYYLDWTNTTNKPDPNIVVSLSGDVTGTANTTLTDLANGSISITTTVAELDDKVNLAGDTMTGFLTLHANPTQGLHAATKNYVDDVATGLQVKGSVEAATTGNLSGTYDNGTSGVGATLTLAASATLDIDGWTSWSQYDGILVKDQTNPEENGRYYVSTVGDSGTNWVLTRCGVCDEPEEIIGAFVFVSHGNTYESTGWVATVQNADTFTVGTDAINWTQFSGAGTYLAGTDLTLVGTTFNLNPTIAANTTGNAASATALQTSRTISLSGDVSGSASFDGTSNANITVTVADNSHNHTASNITDFNSAVTGIVTKTYVDGLNVDADTLDGQHGSYYLNWANVTNKPDPTITLAGDLTGSVTLTDLANGTLTATVVDDSHNHIIANVDGLQTALDGKLSTTGKAADSDLLDGLNSTQFLRSDAGNNYDVRLAPGNGRGLRFWDNDSYKIWMASSTDATWGGRLDSTSDYNMYFRMADGTNRGFVFKNGTTDVFQIESSGQSRQTGPAYVDTTQRVYADNYHPVSDAWTTARTLSLTGDASGSVSWDGSTNATLTVTVADNSHNHTASNITDFSSAVTGVVTKSYVDGLNVDADTLDGMDSTDFVATVGDTLTGALNFTVGTTGDVLTVDGKSAFKKVSLNGGLRVGTDDTLILGAGEAGAAMESNLPLTSEVVAIGGEFGVKFITFPNNNTTWSNRKEINMDADGVFLTQEKIVVNTNAAIDSSAQTIATTTESVVCTFDATAYGSGKIVIQAKDSVSGEVQVSELLVVHDGTTASATEYGTIHTGASPLASYDVDISGGEVRIKATSASSNSTTFKASKTLIAV